MFVKIQEDKSNLWTFNSNLKSELLVSVHCYMLHKPNKMVFVDSSTSLEGKKHNNLNSRI